LAILGLGRRKEKEESSQKAFDWNGRRIDSVGFAFLEFMRRLTRTEGAAIIFLQHFFSHSKGFARTRKKRMTLLRHFQATARFRARVF
jgi:hypothetical protein